MQLIPMLLRRWYVVMPALAIVGLTAFLVDRGAPSSFRAMGVVMVVEPEVDPTRSIFRGIDFASVISGATRPSVRESVVDVGGTSDYTVAAVGPRRIQVLATGKLAEATSTVEAILRHLARAVDRDQADSGRALDERVRSRLLIDVPSDDAVAAGGTTAPSQAQIVGTLVLQDPLDDSSNPFSAANITRLLTATVTSESERERISAQLGEDISYKLSEYDRRAPGMLNLSVSGTEADQSLRAFDVMVDVVNDELEERQVTAAVPVSRRRFLEVLAQPQEALDTSPSWYFPALATLIGGLLIVIGGAAALDGRIRARRHSGDEPHSPRVQTAWPQATPYDRGEPVMRA